MILSHLYNILLYLYSVLHLYIILFSQSNLHNLRQYNFFLYNFIHIILLVQPSSTQPPFFPVQPPHPLDTFISTDQ